MAGKFPKEVNEFLKLSKEKIKPERIILFGSRARGDYLGGSDYDFIFVSDYFKKYSYHDRVVQMLKLMKKSFPADIICLTPEEFEKKKKEISIVKKGVEEGKVLYAAG